MQNNKGFTLIELVVVITILAIIMLIALPNFSGIQYRAKVRADMSTATLVCKAVRVWYTDCMTDDTLYGKLKIKENEKGSEDYSNEADNKFLNEEAWVRYKDLTGISNYSDTEYTPISLIDGTTNKAEKYQFYMVRISSFEGGKGISVGITRGETEDTYDEVPLSTVVNYDGSTPAVVYVEKL